MTEMSGGHICSGQSSERAVAPKDEDVIYTNIINAKVRLFVKLSRKNYLTDHHEILYIYS